MFSPPKISGTVIDGETTSLKTNLTKCNINGMIKKNEEKISCRKKVLMWL